MTSTQVSWLGKSLKRAGGKTYYAGALVSTTDKGSKSFSVRIGDSVLMRPPSADEQPFVARIVSLFQAGSAADAAAGKGQSVRVQWFYRPDDVKKTLSSSSTSGGSAANTNKRNTASGFDPLPNELYLSSMQDDNDIRSIDGLATTKWIGVSDDDGDDDAAGSADFVFRRQFHPLLRCFGVISGDAEASRKQAALKTITDAGADVGADIEVLGKGSSQKSPAKRKKEQSRAASPTKAVSPKASPKGSTKSKSTPTESAPASPKVNGTPPHSPQKSPSRGHSASVTERERARATPSPQRKATAAVGTAPKGQSGKLSSEGAIAKSDAEDDNDAMSESGSENDECLSESGSESDGSDDWYDEETGIGRRAKSKFRSAGGGGSRRSGQQTGGGSSRRRASSSATSGRDASPVRKTKTASEMSKMSDYEKAREARIKRNSMFLDNLGVDEAKAKIASASSSSSGGRGSKRPKTVADGVTVVSAPGVDLKRARPSFQRSPQRPVSRRLRGLAPDAASGAGGGGGSKDALEAAEEALEWMSRRRRGGGGGDDDDDGATHENGTFLPQRRGHNGSGCRYVDVEKIDVSSMTFPLLLDSISTTVYSIGKAPTDPCDQRYWSNHCNMFHHPYPIGYRASKEYFEKTWEMEIVDSDDSTGPLFKVWCDANGKSFQGTTPTGPWTDVCTKAHGKFSSGTRVSGPLYFGFSDPILQRILSQKLLPQGHECDRFHRSQLCLYKTKQVIEDAVADYASAGGNDD